MNWKLTPPSPRDHLLAAKQSIEAAIAREAEQKAKAAQPATGWKQKFISYLGNTEAANSTKLDEVLRLTKETNEMTAELDKAIKRALAAGNALVTKDTQPDPADAAAVAQLNQFSSTAEAAVSGTGTAGTTGTTA